MRRHSLPRLTIEVPCLADWRGMEPIAGDSRVRLCRSCDKPVYDSKAMTRDQLYDLIAKTEGAPPCMQLHRRPDGTIVTKGCLAALWRTGRAVWLKAAALAVAFWAGVFGLRRACDIATAPGAVSVAIRGPSGTMRGMVTVLVQGPEPAPDWMRRRPEKVDIDHAEPLRRLQSEEDLFPPGLR